MSKKKKITGALISTGLALSLLGGSSAVIASAGTATVSATEIIHTRSDGQTSSERLDAAQHFQKDGKMPFGSREELSEKQIAANEAYAELSKEIQQKYSKQYAELIRLYEAEIEKAYVSVLGEPYTLLQEEYDGLCGQYQGLVNGFYGSEEYVELKTELDTLISKLGALDKKSAEYSGVMDKIHTVWGKISVLAGEINSQVILVRTRIAEISSEIKALIQQNQDALYQQLAPIAGRFNTDVQTVQSSLMLELEILRQILGI